jgi:hypothetical protein
LTRTHCKTPLDQRTLFFWSEGSHPGGLHSYAGGSLLCSEELALDIGYPSTVVLGGGHGESGSIVLVDEIFSGWGSFLFHFVLPVRYVPCPDMQPLDIPSDPSVIVRSGERLSATFIIKESGRVRFWMKRLMPHEKLSDYELERLFNKPVERETKATVEINLGILKFSFGNK